MRLSCAWIIAFSAIISAVAAVPFASGGGFNLLCLYDNCYSEMVACKEKNCQDFLTCGATCIAHWDEDTTKGKYDVLNCTSKCQFTYTDDNSDKFMTCAASNDCLELPPIPSTCRAASAKPAKQLSVKDLQGDWWVVRGYHPVFDCYACTHQHFESMSDTTWQFASSSVVTLVDGTHKAFSLKIEMPVEPPGKGFTFTYDFAGAANNATWWVVDKADDGSYVLVYYCGAVADWNYEGAMVMARSTSLPSSAYTKIAESFQSTVGLDLKDFCSNQVTNCNNGKI